MVGGYFTGDTHFTRNPKKNLCEYFSDVKKKRMSCTATKTLPGGIHRSCLLQYRQECFGAAQMQSDLNCNRILCYGVHLHCARGSCLHPVAPPASDILRLLLRLRSSDMRRWVPTFRTILMPSSSGSGSPKHQEITWQKTRTTLTGGSGRARDKQQKTQPDHENTKLNLHFHTRERRQTCWPANTKWMLRPGVTSLLCWKHKLPKINKTSRQSTTFLLYITATCFGSTVQQSSGET